MVRGPSVDDVGRRALVGEERVAVAVAAGSPSDRATTEGNALSTFKPINEVKIHRPNAVATCIEKRTFSERQSTASAATGGHRRQCYSRTASILDLGQVSGQRRVDIPALELESPNETGAQCGGVWRRGPDTSQTAEDDK